MSKPSPTPTTSHRIFPAVKSLLTALVAIAGLALFLAWMGGFFHEKVSPGHIPIERTSAAGRSVVTAESSLGSDTVSVVGTIQPRRKSDIASRLLTTILEIHPRPGDRVKTNDPLVTLDNRELLAQQREAMAALTAAEADLVTRKADFERIKSLRATGSVSAEEFGRIEGAYRVAESQVVRAKETISRLEVQISYTKIVATSDGIITDRLAEPGDLAQPGQPLLRQYDPSDLELHANVPESLATGLALQQTLPVRIDAINATLTTKVQEIVPQAQEASRSVLVKFALPTSTTSSLLPGMFGRVTITVGQMKRIWLPVEAIQTIGQLDLIEIVLPDNTLSRRFVRVGRHSEGRAEILAGIREGERVALPVK